MVAHHTEAEDSKEKNEQDLKNDMSTAQAIGTPELRLRMSSLTVGQCYIPVEGEAKPVAARATHFPGSAEKIALVIPTLHEVESLGVLLDRVLRALKSSGAAFEILVVDDDSRDGTEELVKAYAREDERIRLLIRKGERGLSGAILHGWQHTDAGILAVMDADMQHPPHMLSDLVRAMQQGNDLVVGSRYACGGRLGEWNPARKFISAAAVWVTLPIQRASLRVCDPMSGFFMVRRRCIQSLMFQATGFKLLLEILVRGHLTSVCEVPFSFGSRAAGKSKASIKVALDYLQLLVRLYAIRFGRGAAVIEEAAGD
jgi:dolichol-phosphate mannosyltransferase